MTIEKLKETYEDRLKKILKEHFAVNIRDISNVKARTEALLISEFIVNLRQIKQPIKRIISDFTHM